LSLKFEIIHSLKEAAWRTFVDQHPWGNIFHTPEMFQVFESVQGYRPQLQGVVDEVGCLQALLTPIQVTLFNGPFRRLTTRSIAYGGVLCSLDKTGQDALAVLFRDYSEHAAHEALFTEMRNLSDVDKIQPVLSQIGFRHDNHLDYLIDLDGSPDVVLQNIGARTRKHIRHALRKGDVVVEEMCDPNLMPVWYELVQKSYANAGVPLADRSLFEAAFKVLHPKGMVQFWLARIGSTYVAASAELLYKDVVYGWYSGVDRSFAAESPGELLMWRVLERGCLAGYKIYDFGGAGRPDEEYGVRDFKAKFGGRLVNFGRNTLVHNPRLLRWSELGYKIYRRLINTRFTKHG
jgi:serine/alanine adding enzyme